MVPLRLALPCLLLAACSRTEPPQPSPASALPPAATTRPAPATPDASPGRELEVRSIELDTAPDPEANPRDWVACTAGELVDGERRVPACKAESKTWVNPRLDEVLLVVHAIHGLELRALGQRAAFVEDKARLRLPLRHAMGALPAAQVARETTLSAPFELEHERGVARGELTLTTPRVYELLHSTLEGPLRFPDEPAPSGRPIDADTPVLYLGPELAALPPAPDLPLSSVEVFAIDVGAPVHLPPCPQSRSPRVSRPIELRLVERRTGKLLGERRWPGPISACGPDDPHALAPPAPESIAASVKRLLADQDASRWAEPPLESEALVLGELAPPEPLAKALRGLATQPPNKSALHALWRLPPLDPNSPQLLVLEHLGAPGQHPGVTYRMDGGHLAGVSLGPSPAALPALAPLTALPRDAARLVKTLGRPSAASAEALTWQLDAGDWRLTLTCDLDGLRCDRLALSWDHAPATPTPAFTPPFDLASLPPGNPEQIRRLVTFLGLGPQTDRAALHARLGPPQGPIQRADGDQGELEVHGFGPALGALVDAKSGLLQEVWVVGAEGRDILKFKNLDDPLLAFIGEPMEAAAKALGRPSKVGPGFISWTIDQGPLTIYAELQCPAEDGYRCRELDVGWIVGEDPHHGGDVAPH